MTKEAKAFWTSTAARNFPFTLEIDGVACEIAEQAHYYRQLYKRLVSQHWIPNEGKILDLGAGASSGLLFPQQLIDERITATDVSRLLLAENSVPVERKHILDAGIDTYPGEWNNQFSLVIAMHLSRYLDANEKVHLAQEAHRVLTPGGRILLLDTPQIPNRKVAEALGETGPFSTDQENAILKGSGYKDIRYGSCFITFFDQFNERTGTHIDYVTALRPTA